MLGAGGDHLHSRLDRQLARRNARHRAADRRAYRRVEGHPAHRHRGAYGRVGQDPQAPVLEADEQRGHAVPAEPLRRFAQRVLRIAEHRGLHDRRHGCGPHVEQAVHGVPGVGQALAHRHRDVRGPGLSPKEPASRLDTEQSAGGRLARAHAERGRHAGQHRGMPEAFAGLEHLDRLPLVDEIHRAREDHPHAGCRQSVLDQHRLAGLERVLLGARRETAQLIGAERIERRVTGKECVQVLHVKRCNCVRIAPGTRLGQVGA